MDLPKWVTEGIKLLESSLKPVPAELNEIDWKEDLSSKGGRLAEHISAFANYPNGGFLVFGISPNGKVNGVEQSSVEGIVSKLGSVCREGVSPAVSISHRVVSYEDHSLLLFRIDESSSKPVKLRGQSIEESFIRSAGQTRKMSRGELAQAMLNSHVPRFEELDAGIFDTPAEAIAKLYIDEYYSLLGRPKPVGTDGLIAELKSQKILSERSGRWSITNLGVLLCARNMADFPGHERRGVRLIGYDGLSRVNASREITGKRGYAVGFQGLLQSVLGLLPASEVIKDALRKKVSIYPEVALRELIANMIIHQDLSITGQSPMIEVFSDRVEITNPGRLLPSIEVDRIIDTTPESRNELLARSMRQMGICEERGSGIDRALESIELFGLPPLEFKEMDSSFKVVMFTPRKYQQMDKDERIRATYQHCVLHYLSNKKMTNASLRVRLGISDKNYTMVSRIIRDSVDEHKIKPADPDMKANKHMKYIPYWA